MEKFFKLFTFKKLSTPELIVLLSAVEVLKTKIQSTINKRSINEKNQKKKKSR